MPNTKLTDQQYMQAMAFIVNAQRYRFPIERAHIDTLVGILLTPKQKAAEDAIEALNKIMRVASGEDQVAQDDTEGMAWIDTFCRAALAKAGQQ